MNLADYISELLGQQDNVTVPGLGHFERIHVNAHYNDSEARFYPPYHQVSFAPDKRDDDSFASYVAKKKNISLSSSKYFVEKFIGKLNEDAEHGKFLFADLGSFTTEGNQLIFKANDRIPADPAYYGYPPLDISKIGQPLSVDTKKPVFAQTQTSAAQQDIAADPATARHDYFDDDADRKKGISLWFILLLAFFIVVFAVLAVYKFYPSAFDGVKYTYSRIFDKKLKPETSKKVIVYKDTIKGTITPPTPKDTIKGTVTPPAPKDTVKPARFEAIAYECPHLWTANAKVGELKKQGYNAYIVMDAPGPLIKVSVGVFPSYDKADSVVQVMLKARKIRKHYIPIEIRSN